MVNASLRDAVADILASLAESIMLPRFHGLQDHEIQEKTPGELVTVVDREVELALESLLPKLLPGSHLIGEEGVAADRNLLGRLDAGDVWLVDPLDGTANFVGGNELFASMVALLHNGECIASWIHAPVAGTLAYAERGGGAYLDSQLVTSHRAAPQVGSVRGAISTTFLPGELRAGIIPRSAALAEVLPGMRCAGLEYPAVAAGAQDFAMFWRTLPWDHAAGTLFLTEAGGVVTRLDGSPYRLSDPGSGLLAARTPQLWEMLFELLLDRGQVLRDSYCS